MPGNVLGVGVENKFGQIETIIGSTLKHSTRSGNEEGAKLQKPEIVINSEGGVCLEIVEHTMQRPVNRCPDKCQCQHKQSQRGSMRAMMISVSWWSHQRQRSTGKTGRTVNQEASQRRESSGPKQLPRNRPPQRHDLSTPIQMECAADLHVLPRERWSLP